MSTEQPEDQVVQSEMVTVEPQRRSASRRFSNYEEVRHWGKQDEDRLVDGFRRAAEAQDVFLGEVEVQWEVRVQAIGYPYPEELKISEAEAEEMQDQGLDPDVEDDVRRENFRFGVDRAASRVLPLALSLTPKKPQSPDVLPD